MKKILSVLLALCLLLGASCAMASEATAKSNHVIVTALSADPVTLDVHMNNVTPGNSITKALTGSLFKSNEQGNGVVLCYAESYTVSDDGLVYTFTMKDDAKFSDGTPMDANDVYYSFMHILSPETGSTLQTDLNNTVVNAREYNTGACTAEDVGIKVLDDKTIEFTLIAPTPWWISQCGLPYAIVPNGIYEKNPEWWKSAETFVSAGPFMLKAANPLEAYELVKNPNYPAADAMEIEGVTFVIIEAGETEAVAYRNGEIDASFNLTTDAKREYAGSDEYFTVDKLGIQYCDFNCQLPEFKDPRVRTAFAISVDREWIISDILESDCKPLYGFVPHSQPSLTQSGKSYREVAGDLFAEDCDRARELMAEAGYPNGEGFPVVQLKVRATDEQKNLAEALQSIWQEELGVTVEIVTVEASSTYWSELADGLFSIDRSGYTVSYIDPSANLDIWKSGGNAFENQWPDEEGRIQFNEMMVASKTLGSEAEREAALIEAEKYLVEYMPGFPMYSYNEAYLIKPYISNLVKGQIATAWEYATFAD